MKNKFPRFFIVDNSFIRKHWKCLSYKTILFKTSPEDLYRKSSFRNVGLLVKNYQSDKNFIEISKAEFVLSR